MEEDNGMKISELQEIKVLSGEEMIPLAINNTNGYVKTKVLSSSSITNEEIDSLFD